MKREFPCKDVLINFQQQAPREFWRQGCDDYEELMVTLGAIVHEGNEDMRMFVDGLLQQDNRGDLNAHYARGRQPSIFSKLPHPSLSTPSGKDISLLKEFGDRIGQLPEYHEEKVRDVPPLFRSVLRFNAKRYKGEGKSKKEARQMAAHHACRELRIGADRQGVGTRDS
jgi:hypothetical protein